MVTTLGELLASSTFTGYPIDTYCDLDADDIEQLLYGRSYGDWEQAGCHHDRFCKAESLTTVCINTWICTDTRVGLEVYCLNGVAFALSWQTGRKSDQHRVLISKEARDRLMERWEAHRETAAPEVGFLDPTCLALPINAPGQRAFDIDTNSPVERLTLSGYGVAQWLDTIGGAEKLDTIHNPDTLALSIKSVETTIAQDQRLLESIATLQARENDTTLYADEADQAAKRVAWGRDAVLAPLQARHRALTQTP